MKRSRLIAGGVLIAAIGLAGWAAAVNVARSTTAVSGAAAVPFTTAL